MNEIGTRLNTYRYIYVQDDEEELDGNNDAETDAGTITPLQIYLCAG